ncbi:MAG: Arc family DNA-binding protein [Janthinobacterium lividum]
MRKDAKIQLRLPVSIRDWFAEFAAKNNRSMNGQMIVMLEECKEKQESQKCAA